MPTILPKFCVLLPKNSRNSLQGDIGKGPLGVLGPWLQLLPYFCLPPSVIPPTKGAQPDLPVEICYHEKIHLFIIAFLPQPESSLSKTLGVQFFISLIMIFSINEMDFYIAGPGPRIPKYNLKPLKII
jgi:hypothetical protein